MPGIEPGAFHMQSERSTTEPHPRCYKELFHHYLKLFKHICIAYPSGQKLQLSRYLINNRFLIDGSFTTKVSQEITISITSLYQLQSYPRPSLCTGRTKYRNNKNVLSV